MLDWKQFRKDLFRLQQRLFKATASDNKRKVRSLQKLILRSRAARFLAIRQVTQLNAGKKTAGVDGKASLNFKERFSLEDLLKTNWMKWKHQPLKEVQIPKKDGTTRGLKIPTIQDRAWQCLAKYAIEPLHEALFHQNSYGFRPGRSTWDCQKLLFINLHSGVNGHQKRIISLDIEKCFDRIDHNKLMSLVQAPQNIKQGLWRCLKAGTETGFGTKTASTEAGTPQGGIISPLLANIALDGIESIHKSIRYADDMVIILKPKDNAKEILSKIEDFLGERGLNVSQKKTKLNASTDGFDFLGWHFYVQSNNNKFRCVPSVENFKTFNKKVKSIVQNSCYGAKTKASKIASIVRGWKNYHKFCKMDGSRFSLWHLNHSTFRRFLKEKTMTRYEAERLVKLAFPPVGYSENKHINVKGDKSPYDGDTVYWSQRNSKMYDGITAKKLKKQHHRCGHCGLSLLSEEKVHLHHVDGNHNNWKSNNLIALHQSCHQYVHMSNSEKE